MNEHILNKNNNNMHFNVERVIPSNKKKTSWRLYKNVEFHFKSTIEATTEIK
jgi:hypothetical protein